MGFTADWQLTLEDIDLLLAENPSLRGMVQGYVAELKLRAELTSHENVLTVDKIGDHESQGPFELGLPV